MGTPFRWLVGSSWISNLGDGIGLAAGPLLIASHTYDPFLVFGGIVAGQALGGVTARIWGSPARSGSRSSVRRSCSHPALPHHGQPSTAKTRFMPPSRGSTTKVTSPAVPVSPGPPMVSVGSTVYPAGKAPW
jgi:hypothetical protein